MKCPASKRRRLLCTFSFLILVLLIVGSVQPEAEERPVEQCKYSGKWGQWQVDIIEEVWTLRLDDQRIVINDTLVEPMKDIVTSALWLTVQDDQIMRIGFRTKTRLEMHNRERRKKPFDEREFYFVGTLPVEIQFASRKMSAVAQVENSNEAASKLSLEIPVAEIYPRTSSESVTFAVDIGGARYIQFNLGNRIELNEAQDIAVSHVERLQAEKLANKCRAGTLEDDLNLLFNAL